MGITDDIRYIEESIHQFTDPIQFIRKANRLATQAQRLGGETSQPKVVVVYDSRIPMPPELVFAQNLGDLYVLQLMLDTSDVSSIAAGIEFARMHYDCRLFVLAIPDQESNINAKQPQQVVSQVCQSNPLISQWLKEGSLQSLAFSVSLPGKKVAEIPL